MTLSEIKKFKNPIGLVVKSLERLQKKHYISDVKYIYISKKDFNDQLVRGTKNLYILQSEVGNFFNILNKSKCGFDCISDNDPETIIPYWAIEKLINKDDVEYFI